MNQNPAEDADNPLGDRASLSGSETLVLDDPHQAWQVERGEIAVFITALEQGRPIGPRHALVTVQAGGMLIGASHTDSDGNAWGLVATALQPAELRSVGLNSPDNAATIMHPDSPTPQGNSRQWAGIVWWISKLTEVLTTDANFVHAPRLSDFGPQTLEVGQAAGSVGRTVNWIRVHTGRLVYCGFESLAIDHESGFVPLGPETWVVATTASEITVGPTRDIVDQEELIEGLARLHTMVFRRWELRRQREAEAERTRLRERRSAVSQETSAVLREIGATLQKPRETQRAESDLLTALTAVGDRLHLEFQAPPIVEMPQESEDSVEAHCRAARIPFRRVKLRGDWYHSDVGCLLAVTRTERKPVALLPNGDNRYDLFDPQTLRRICVDARTAATLSTDAWMFYRPFPEKMNTLWDIYRFVLPSVRKDLVMMIGLTASGIVLGMLTPRIMQQFVDEALPSADRQLILDLMYGFLAVSFGQTLLAVLQSVMMSRLQTLSTSSLQAALWDRLLRLPIRSIRVYSSGDLVNRCSIVAEISQSLSGTVLRTILTGAMSVLNFAVLFSFSPPLAAVAVVIMVVLVTVTVWLARRIRTVAVELEQQSSRQFGLLVQFVSGIAKLRIAGAELRAYNLWIRQYAQQLRTHSRLQRWQSAGFVFNFVLPVLSTLVLYYTATNVIAQASQSPANTLSMGGFWAFMSGFGALLGGATGFSTSLIEIMDSLAKFRLAHPILSGRLEVTAVQRDPGRLSGAIVLEDISFRYQADGPLILNHLSLRAHPGEFVAIVGKSGSGKSTLFRLLLGFETPESGRVLYDRHDLAGLDLGAVRRQVGVVLQASRINASTVYETITGDRQMTLEEAWIYAEEAGLADDIRAMPMGMHTMISEGGTTLSGGQRQRLMIARALASEAKILLLDEATSALDNLSQKTVSDSIRRRKVTRITIAHRLSTIRDADRIYVLENGQIAQTGTFLELTNSPGPFLQMMERQTV